MSLTIWVTYTHNNKFLNNIRIIILLAHIQFIIKFDELYIQARQKLKSESMVICISQVGP